MEEIFVILSYTPTFEQQQLLRDLVFKLKKNNQKVLIISHTHIPEDIIKLADYYFYDSENPLLEVWKHTEGFNFYRNEYFLVESQFDIFKYFNYGLAVYKLVSLGLSLAKNLGYKKCHMIEYDTDFSGLNYFDEANLNLEEKDCIFFKTGQFEGTPILLGSCTSFNLDKYTYDEFNFDKQEIKHLLRKGTTAGMAEIVTFEKLIKNKNYLMLDKESINNVTLNLSSTLKTHSGFDKNISLIPCVVKNTNNVILFGDNKTDQDIKFEIIINNTFISFEVKSRQWRYINLCTLDELTKIKVYLNNKFINELDFENTIPKEEFRLKSIFTNQ